MVVEPGAGDPRDHPVRERRGQPAPQQGIAAPAAPAAHDVVAPLLHDREQPRDVAGIVLLVAVHGHHRPPSREAEAGADRRRLPEVAPELDDADARVATVPRQRPLAGRVPAAVVDEDDLGRLGHGVEHPEQLLDHGVDVLLLVVEGDHDAQVDTSCHPHR